jgi:tRNA-guanine family transglycosylase
MAMDLAGKYTHRQKESEHLHYLNISKKLSNSSKINIELLAKTLDVLKDKKLKSLIYAPIHGQTPKEYGDFVNSLLDLEEQKNVAFDGFGLGGIANYKEKNNEDWEIHEKVNSRVKSGIIISKATQAVRKVLDKRKDYRPIHALGVGSAENIIPLVNAGADTFDAHSAWRRIIDGSRNDAKNVFDEHNKGTFSKYIIPLLDNKLNVINENQEKVLKYIKLNKLSKNVFCDCHICTKYPVEKIKNLYSDEVSNESFHFAKILCYVHNVNQHQKICERLHRDLKNGDSVLKLINEITDIKLKNDYKEILSHI